MTPPETTPQCSRSSIFVWLLGILSLSVFVIGFTSLSVSCVSQAPATTLARLPSIEGATPIGSTQCSVCHPTTHLDFEGATHANLGFAADGPTGDQRCESCHGPGSLHMAMGGDVTKIINPRDDPATCLACHQDKAAQLHLPGAHPIVNGKVTCVDCHSVHTGPASPRIGHGMTAEDQACFECHQLQSGPFVFEHEAMREGCTFCHDPHGTGNDKMLRTRDANLCLQCHLSDLDTSIVQIGNQVHSGPNFLSQGTCWTASCHEGVHGSNVSPKLRY